MFKLNFFPAACRKITFRLSHNFFLKNEINGVFQCYYLCMGWGSRSVVLQPSCTSQAVSLMLRFKLEFKVKILLGNVYNAPTEYFFAQGSQEKEVGPNTLFYLRRVLLAT